MRDHVGDRQCEYQRRSQEKTNTEARSQSARHGDLSLQAYAKMGLLQFSISDHSVYSVELRSTRTICFVVREMTRTENDSAIPVSSVICWNQSLRWTEIIESGFRDPMNRLRLLPTAFDGSDRDRRGTILGRTLSVNANSLALRARQQK